MNNIEHINLTVSDPDGLAELLTNVFDWQIRWSGKSLDNGRTIHIGNTENGSSYLALYTNHNLKKHQNRSHLNKANLNHIGILVSDLEQIEQRVLDFGLITHNHADYEPGRRFYFHIDDDIEIEVISY